MSNLKISPELSLPIEAVTQTFALLAVKGTGKSYLASVMAEEMLSASQQVIVLDPTGAWWGLQSSADGTKEGFAIVIFGGDHGNVPLEEHSAEVIAKAIVENGFSAIIDFSLMRKGEVNRFSAIFLETLYRLNRKPVHLFVDEADAFAPQKGFPEGARTLGAMEDIVRRGRKRGIGCTVITQRPAVINKDVLTQCEILICLRMSHPKDINAINEWVSVHASKQEAADMINNLPSMPIGQAYVWSPSWLKVFKHIKVRKRTTFDSGATPMPGEIIQTPKRLSKIDMQQLGEKMEIEHLKKGASSSDKIKKLQQELNEKNLLGKTLLEQIEQAKKLILKTREALDSVTELFSSRTLNTNFKSSTPITELPIKPIQTTTPLFYENGGNNGLKLIQQAGDTALGRCEKAILTVLAQRNPRPSSKIQLGILSGYSPNSGGFNNAISKLRQMGYASGSSEISITGTRLDALGTYTRLPTGRELHAYWLNKLPKCESTILDYLIQMYPASCIKEEIGVATRYSHTSGGFNNAISKLRTIELITGSKEICAAQALFE